MHGKYVDQLVRKNYYLTDFQHCNFILGAQNPSIPGYYRRNHPLSEDSRAERLAGRRNFTRIYWGVERRRVQCDGVLGW